MTLEVDRYRRDNDPLRGKKPIDVALAVGQLHTLVTDELSFDGEMLSIICELAMHSIYGRGAGPTYRGAAQ